MLALQVFRSSKDFTRTVLKYMTLFACLGGLHVLGLYISLLIIYWLTTCAPAFVCLVKKVRIFMRFICSPSPFFKAMSSLAIWEGEGRNVIAVQKCVLA